MTIPYRHTQIGWVIIVALLFGAAITVPIMTSIGTSYALIAAALLALILAMFATLTVEVDSHSLRFRFGIGLIRKEIPVGDIRSFKPVRTPWYYGWGIRLFPGGILYNVSGQDAVELFTKSGKRLRIGTDEPESLSKALEAVAGPSEPPSAVELARASRGPLIALGIIVGLVVLLVGGVGVSFALMMRQPQVTVSQQSVEVGMFAYGDTYALQDISAVELRETLPNIQARTNGFALGDTLRGYFRLDGYDTASLFVEHGHPPYLFLSLKDRPVIINYEDPAETRAVHGRVLEHWKGGASRE